MAPPLEELLARTGLPDKPDPYYDGMSVLDVDACDADDTKARRIVVGSSGGSEYVDFPQSKSLNPQFQGADVGPYYTRILTAAGGFVYSREAEGSGGRRIPLGQGMLHLCREGDAVYISDNAIINNMPANTAPLVRLPVALPFRIIKSLVRSGLLQPSQYQLDPAGRPDFRYLNLLPDGKTIDRLIEFAANAGSPIPEKWRPTVAKGLEAIKPAGEEIAKKSLEMQKDMRSDMMWQILGSTFVGAAIGLYSVLLASGKAGPINNAVSAPFRGLYNLIRAPFDRGEGLARFWRDLSTPLRYRGIPTLLKVGTNMTEQARMGEFRPVADPTTPKVAEQIENTINSRFNTMSVLVEGPPGWGKEEVMRTLSLRNPNTVYIKVTPNGLMGGTMYRGQLEERLSDIPKEIAKARKGGQQVVLFVDEFHEALSAGKSMEQTTSLLEHWKGELARGDIRVVGFSTPRELLKARYIAGLYNDPAARARLSPEYQEEVNRFEREGVRQNIELRPLLNRFQPLPLPPRPASDIEVILKDTIEARKASGLTVEMDDATIKRIAQLSESPIASEGYIPRTAFAIFNGVVDANATQGSGTVRVTTEMIDRYVETNYPDIAQRPQMPGGSPSLKELFTEKTFADQIRSHYPDLRDPKFEKLVGAAARVAQGRWAAAVEANPDNPPLTIARDCAFPREDFM
ncbi:MAG TPA: AAA family ATPase, partial [bacterium]|nr:AAA family ATPase [bacterium]